MQLNLLVFGFSEQSQFLISRPYDVYTNAVNILSQKCAKFGNVLTFITTSRNIGTQTMPLSHIFFSQLNFNYMQFQINFNQISTVFFFYRYRCRYLLSPSCGFCMQSTKLAEKLHSYAKHCIWIYH